MSDEASLHPIMATSAVPAKPDSVLKKKMKASNFTNEFWLVTKMVQFASVPTGCSYI